MAALRVATFRRLWIASLFFNVGHLIQMVASSWMMLELTGSPLWVSLMVGAPLLPLLVLSLPAGAAADLFDRRRIIIVSSAIVASASVGMALLWAADAVTPPRLLGLGLLLGVGVAFFNPSWQAIVPRLVPMGLVPGAVALNSASAGVAFAVGPALGGVLVASLGAGWSLAIAAAGYTAILISVAITPTGAWRQETGSLTTAMMTGLRYLRFSVGYRWLLLLGALFGFTSSAVRALLPNITSDVLAGGSELYGTLLGAFGAGALVGGLTRGHGGEALARHLVPAAVMLYGVAGAVLAWSTSVALSLAMIFAVGVAWTWVLSTLNSTFQVLSPDWVRGRAMSAFVLSVFGIMPIGNIASGGLGDVTSAPVSLFVFSLAVVVLGVVSLRMPTPVLEHLEPPEVPEIEDGDEVAPTVAPTPVVVITTWTLEEEEFTPFVEVLAELRRVRLSTGAYYWRVFRSAYDFRRVSEVFMVHSWEQHLQQHRRLDRRGRQVIDRAERFGGGGEVITDHLIGFDVADPERRPAWHQLLLEHEQMHKGRRSHLRG